MSELFKNITIEETKKLISQGAAIADIRDNNSYMQEHIENAIHLSNDNISDFILHGDFEKPLVVYCYHGHSSQNAAHFLAEQGFEEVYSMIGGYTEWTP